MQQERDLWRVLYLPARQCSRSPSGWDNQPSETRHLHSFYQTFCHPTAQIWTRLTTKYVRNEAAGLASSWRRWTEVLLCSRISPFSFFCISQGSAATHLRCGGQCGMDFVANFSENTTVKELWNQPTFVKVINECIVAQFYWLTVYIHAHYADATQSEHNHYKCP